MDAVDDSPALELEAMLDGLLALVAGGTEVRFWRRWGFGARGMGWWGGEDEREGRDASPSVVCGGIVADECG